MTKTIEGIAVANGVHEISWPDIDEVLAAKADDPERFRELQKLEAECRLRVLIEAGLMPEVLDMYKEGRLSYSERASLCPGQPIGLIYWVDEKHHDDVIERCSEEENCIVYHATLQSMVGFGQTLDLYHVSNEPEEWLEDRSDLSDGYSFVLSVGVPSMSRFLGSVKFVVSGGGLVKVR